MKKIIYYILTAVVCAGFAACSDQNDVVDDLIDEIKNKPVVKKIEYTLTTADYGTISAAAVKDAGDNAANKALAEAVKTTGSLNSFADPVKYIPRLLAPKYPALGLESAVQVTYAYTPDYLAGLTTNPPASDLTTIVEENFNGYTPATSAPFTKWDQNGWKTFVTKGTKYWGVKTRKVDGVDTFYSEVTSYANRNTASSTDGTALDVENEIYVVSPAINMAGTTDNNFSFDLCVGSYTHSGLSVLISTDAKATSDPAAVAWDDVTSNFTIPTTPTSSYGPWASAGIMNLDTKYAGKTIYIAFRYVGGYPNAPETTNRKTTTYQIDNILVASGKVITPKPGEVYIDDPEKGWVVYPDGIALVAADYTAMGVTSLTAATAPNYLPVFLAQKFPYALENDRKAVVYGANKDEYVYKGGKWAPTIVGAPITEQYVNDGTKWIFDPTVKYTMTKDDYQMVVTAVLGDPATSMFTQGTYTNVEWYYGFSAYRGNVCFRLSGSNESHATETSVKYDTELHKLDGKPDEQVALLWKRLEQKGMPLFLRLKYPTSAAIAQGVPLHYNITVGVYAADGSTTVQTNYVMRYKVVTAGSAGNPPVFEFVSTTAI